MSLALGWLLSGRAAKKVDVCDSLELGPVMEEETLLACCWLVVTGGSSGLAWWAGSSAVAVFSALQS